jgi:hypothetical protein
MPRNDGDRRERGEGSYSSKKDNRGFTEIYTEAHRIGIQGGYKSNYDTHGKDMIKPSKIMRSITHAEEGGI